MSGSSYTQVPTIILKGQWLKAAGFEAGQYVEIVCEEDNIVLSRTTAPEQTTKKSLEDKIKDLDKSVLHPWTEPLLLTYSLVQLEGFTSLQTMNLIDFQISEMQKILLLICESRVYHLDAGWLEERKRGITKC